MKSSPVNVIRVLIADDHPVVREGLAAILRSEPDIQVVAEATDGVHACLLYDQHLPDVVILYLRMPQTDGLQLRTDLMVKAHVKAIILKLGAAGRTEAIAIAMKRGLIRES